MTQLLAERQLDALVALMCLRPLASCSSAVLEFVTEENAAQFAVANAAIPTFREWIQTLGERQSDALVALIDLRPLASYSSAVLEFVTKENAPHFALVKEAFPTFRERIHMFGERQSDALVALIGLRPLASCSSAVLVSVTEEGASHFALVNGALPTFREWIHTFGERQSDAVVALIGLRPLASCSSAVLASVTEENAPHFVLVKGALPTFR